ncbi:MAG: rRNA pseudouridine synthase [Clostridia bacterium]|nr:rRNA pseudouridine synthase [Clostridia bacterium]
MRINKFIASCGICSRRKAEEFVRNGEVKVNGEVVTSLVFDVGENDRVTLQGVEIQVLGKKDYVMLHKPKGYITAMSDDKGRRTVVDLLPDNLKHLKPVGRLDYDSEGLLIMTNDGELAFALTHPSHEVPKKYVVRIEGQIKESELAVIRKGVVIDGERLASCKAVPILFDGKDTKIEIIIKEGKNRQIRKMFEAIGKIVVFLKRVSIGDLELGNLSRGGHRELTVAEVEYLKTL